MGYTWGYILNMVLVSTADRRKIYDYLLSEGVFCSKKDYEDRHVHEILGIRNLHCFLVMRSLVSRKLCREVFSWQWHYYTLTPEGVKFLRDYFGLPATVIPNTHKAEREEERTEEGAEGVEGEAQPEGERSERPTRGGRTRGRGGRRGRE